MYTNRNERPHMSRDVDCSHLFALERVFRRWPRVTQELLLAAFSAPGWVAGVRALVNEWSR